MTESRLSIFISFFLSCQTLIWSSWSILWAILSINEAYRLIPAMFWHFLFYTTHLKISVFLMLHFFCSVPKWEIKLFFLIRYSHSSTIYYWAWYHLNFLELWCLQCTIFSLYLDTRINFFCFHSVNFIVAFISI